jgi:hypothetical protein
MQWYFPEDNHPVPCYRIAKGRVVRGFFPWDPGGTSSTVSMTPDTNLFASVQTSFDVRNVASGMAIATDPTLAYQLTVVPTDGDTTSMASFSLNGLPPGVPYNGVVSVPVGGTTRVDVTVAASNLTGEQFYDLVFAYDMDGDAVPDAATVVGLGDFTNQDLVGAPGGPVSHDPLRWVRASPNPFVGSSAIEFDMDAAARAEVTIYDVAGRRVRDLTRDLSAGRQRIMWDGRDEDGRVADSGVYLVRVRIQRREVSAKVLLMRRRR